MSDGPVPDAADWWKRLYARHGETGLYPLLLEHPDDFVEPACGPYGADIDAATYLRSEWTEGCWPPFEEWPGLATPAAVVSGIDERAGEVAATVVRESWARCLALVQCARGADVPAALGWRGMGNHMDAEELSAVLRSWEGRFGLRVVAFGHGSLFASVASRPADPHQARVLAAEQFVACPDVFHNDPDLDWSTCHEDLMKRHDWYFWWD